MTTIRQIVTDALREGNVIAVGDTPPDTEFDEALRRIQTIISGLYGSVVGEPLKDVSFGDTGLVNSFAKNLDASPFIAASYVPLNVRLIFNNDVTSTIYLHPTPQDGSRLSVIDNGGDFSTHNVTVNANGRKIESASSVILSTAALNRSWFYRADLGQWVRISDLIADDESPFPREFDDLLITTLAVRLNPRFGIDTKKETAAVLGQMRTMFRARYKQKIEQPVEIGLLRLRGNRLISDLSSEDLFDLGRQ